MEVQYLNLYVSDLDRSLAFFEGEMGLSVQFAHADFGYASLDAGPIRMGLAMVDANDPEQASLLGRKTGIGFCVGDLGATFDRLSRAGVRFTMEPSKQPWGSLMAMFLDPDGNEFYLDEA